MKEYLTQIEKILNSNLQGVTTNFEGLSCFFDLKNKASENELVHFFVFEHKLPDDYLSFLNEYNGGILYGFDNFCGFKFLGTGDILSENIFQMQNFGDYWDKQIVLFCICLGDGEYLGFKYIDKSNIQIIHCIMDELPSQWPNIEMTFDNFMNRLILEGGRKFWLK